jgi:hypothetical protein
MAEKTDRRQVRQAPGHNGGRHAELFNRRCNGRLAVAARVDVNAVIKPLAEW